MIWPFRRDKTPPAPSLAAQESINRGKIELEEAKKLRSDFTLVGAALRAAHQENHIAASLAAAIALRSRT